jgi:Zn-finger nucleic acid-binding protein
MVLHRDPDQFTCAYCGSMHLPSCSADGMRLLGENAEGIRCPLCSVILQLASLEDRYRSYRCDKCHGLLFVREIFSDAMTTRRGRAVTPAALPAPPRPEELRRRLACPVCSRVMSTHQYMGPGNIVIDTCDACDLIWLDPGEFDKVVDAPGRDRGTPLMPPGAAQPQPAEPRAARAEAPAEEGSALAALLTFLFPPRA